MKRKKILIITPISLFPTIMMSQVRTLNIIKRLSKDHTVDVASLAKDTSIISKAKNELEKHCNEFYPIPVVNPLNNRKKRIFYGLVYLINYFLFGFSNRYFYWRHKKSTKTIIDIINKNNYDIIYVDFWFISKIFNEISHTNTHFVVDTHCVSYYDYKGRYNHQYNNKIPLLKKRELNKTKKLEIKCLNSANLVVANSYLDINHFKENIYNPSFLLIQNGQDIEYFSNYKTKINNNTILFYGSLGGIQNILAFKRFWYKIYPLLKEKKNDINVLIVGANPPQFIKELHNGNSVVVTGYVEDVRESLSQANLMILPLDVGAGFRGRTVEVMAMGIPVVGTHNAFDNIGIENGIHGFISDDDNEMADSTIKLLNEPELRNKMSKECKKFVANHYSIEATYGKLSKHLFNI